MRERKYVKFRVDMYDDTKSKIIEMKPERDLIHYVWNRVVVLAGKVNLEGDLYLSKTIPYSMETLAIEFNRNIEQIKVAFDLLIELEMLEFTEDKVYRVKNFAKHQNIKVKEKDKVITIEKSIKNKEIEIKKEKDFKDEVKDLKDIKDEEAQEKIINEINTVNNHEIEEKNMENIVDLNVTNKEICKVNNDLSDNKYKKNLEDNIPIILEVNRGKAVNKKKRKDNSLDIIESIEEEEDNSISDFSEGEYKLSQSERILTSFTMN